MTTLFLSILFSSECCGYSVAMPKSFHCHEAMQNVWPSSSSRTIIYGGTPSTLNLKADDNDDASILSTAGSEISEVTEYIVLGGWIAALSGFLLFNNYVRPFPPIIQQIPVQYFGLMHAVSAMLFGGGIVLTTLIEWLVVGSRDSKVLIFWFQQVPSLDSKIVLPALAGLIFSGVGLAVDHYDSLGESPYHVVASLSTLLAFAVWWAATDLTTQRRITSAVEEWANGNNDEDLPRVLQFRRISNVISCAFVVAIYSLMVLKPGFGRF